MATLTRAANTAHPGLLRRVFSFPVFLGSALAVGAFATTSWDGIPAGKVFASGDTWWLTAVGEQVLSTGSWPRTDPYSFIVHGNPWVVYEWFSGVAMAEAMRMGNLRGLAAVFTLLSIAFVALLYYYARLRSGNSRAAAIACGLMLPFLGPLLSLRAQLPGYIFLIVTLICLEHFRQGRSKALWILPGIFALWVNTHGTFVFGLAVLILSWACGLINLRLESWVSRPWTTRQRRSLLVVLLLSTLALVVTPYGTRLAAYPLEFTQLQSIARSTAEWSPLDLHTSLGLSILGLLLAYVISQVWFRVPQLLSEAVLLIIAAGATFWHARFLFFLIIVLAPGIAATLARWLPSDEPENDRWVLNASLIALLAAGMVFSFPSQATLNASLARLYPERAVEYLEQHADLGRMYNDDAWGSYLIERLGTRHKVFIDGRFDLYDYAGILTDFTTINNLLPGTDRLLRKYDFRSFLLHRACPLEGYLASSPNWKRVYMDDTSTIFARQAGLP